MTIIIVFDFSLFVLFVNHLVETLTESGHLSNKDSFISTGVKQWMFVCVDAIEEFSPTV